MPEPKFGSWVVEPMSELSQFIDIKSDTTLHVKSNAQNVYWMLRASHCFINGFFIGLNRFEIRPRPL